MDASARIGQRIGRYLIEATLGSGGMGEVFRAFDELLRRRVALKLLHVRDLPGDDSRAHDALDRILREARMAAALDHPNVVSIFDVGEHDGVAFIVMEYVLGQSLRSLIGAEITIETRIHWLADVARALRAAHRAGLVHRDIKPENVMVRNDGVVKVLDFGIARAVIDPGKRVSHPSAASDALGVLPDDLRVTVSNTIESGGLVGTPGYMPPEQMLHGLFDARSDQFAWGVMAYEVIALRMPWSRDDDMAALIAGALYETALPLASVAMGVPARFAAAVDRALAKDPAARFDSMDSLLEESGTAHAMTIAPPPMPVSAEDVPFAPTAASGSLSDSIREGKGRVPPATIGTAPPAVTQRTDAPVRTNRRALGMALVALALASAGGTSWLLRQRARLRAIRAASSTPTISITREQRLTFDDGCEEYPTFLPDDRRVLFDAADGEDYHLFLLDLASGQRTRVTSDHGWQYAAALSPDGTQAAYLSREGSRGFLNVVPLDGSAPPRHIGEGGVRPSWSADGHCVWGGDQGVAACIDVRTGARVRQLQAPGHEEFRSVFEFADGRLAARTEVDGEDGMARVDVFSGSGRFERTLISGAIEESVTLSPSGRSLLVARSTADLRTQVVELFLDGSGMQIIANPTVHPTKGLHFSHRADRIVWSDCAPHSSHGTLLPAPDGSLVFTSGSPLRDWADSVFALIPGTDNMVVQSNRRGRPEAFVTDRSLRTQTHAIEGLNDVRDVAVSPDGRTVAIGVNATGIFLAPIDGSAPPHQLTHGVRDAHPAFSRDGTRVYFESRDEHQQPHISQIAMTGGVTSVVLPAGTGAPSTSFAANVVGYLHLDGTDALAMPYVRDLDTGIERPLSPEIAPGTYSPIAFSPDGHHAAITDYARVVLEVDLDTSRVIGRYDAGGDQVTGIGMTAAGVRITRGAWSGDLWIADSQGR